MRASFFTLIILSVPKSETHSEVDARLIERLKNREVQAMTAMYDRFKRLVFSIAYQCVRDQAIAEDLTQETFFRIWNRIASFDAERGRLEPWVATIARNQAVDYLRSSRNAPQFSLDVVEPSAALFSVESGALRTERAELISKALLTLNPEQREVIELTHFQGLTQMEIAEYLKRPLGTIKSTVRSALRVLREAMREDVA